MKKTLVMLLALGVSTLAGCSNRYQITLNNSHTITARGKPKFDKATNTYRFKDAKGKPSYVPALNVRQIEPL